MIFISAYTNYLTPLISTGINDIHESIVYPHCVFVYINEHVSSCTKMNRHKRSIVVKLLEQI